MEVKFRNIEKIDAELEASLKAPYTIRLFANRQLNKELPAARGHEAEDTRVLACARSTIFFA